MAPSLLPQPHFGIERDPALHFGGMMRREGLDALPGRLEADGAELPLDLRIFDHLDDGRAELLARLIRQPRWTVDAEPAGDDDPRHAGLFEGRHVRQRGLAIGAR